VLGLVDRARIQVRVDGHLPPRHAVQGKARRHFADPRGAFGNDHELNHYDDQKDYAANDDPITCHELTETLDDPPAADSPSSPARVKMSRVEATLSTSLPSVVANSREGKTLNSSGVLT